MTFGPRQSSNFYMHNLIWFSTLPIRKAPREKKTVILNKTNNQTKKPNKTPKKNVGEKEKKGREREKNQRGEGEENLLRAGSYYVACQVIYPRSCGCRAAKWLWDYSDTQNYTVCYSCYILGPCGKSDEIPFAFWTHSKI